MNFTLTELPNHRPDTDLIKAIRLIADKLEYQQRDIDQNKEAIAEIRDHVEELNAKIIAIDENYYSISGYCVDGLRIFLNPNIFNDFVVSNNNDNRIARHFEK